MEWWEGYDEFDVQPTMLEQQAWDILKRLESRNYSGRAFVVNQRNCRQLQLDIEASLRLCKYFAGVLK